MAQAKQQSEAFIGNGKVYFEPVKGGVIGTPFWVGVASAASFSHAIEDEKEMKEYHSGDSQTWDTFGGSKSTTLSITLNERRLEAMKAALQATETKVITGTVTDEQHTVAAIGDIVFLQNKNTSDVVITDSTPSTPQPLVEGIDYKIDEEFGTIEILNVASLVQPLVIGYTYGASTKLKPMTSDVDYYRVRIDGLNKVGRKDKQVVTAYRAKLKPADTYDLIGDDFSTMEIEADLMFDEAENASYEIVRI